MNAQEYEFHEFANIYRLLEGADFQAMVASIKTGQRNPITLYQGKILDGRNRYKACIAAGIAPRFSTYEGDDPVGEISALNDIRRHDTMAERALVGARMANLKSGRPLITANAGYKQTPVITIDRAAHLSGASTSMIERAKPIVAKGAPELIKAVESGAATVYAAEQIAKLPTERQVDIVSKGAEHIKEKAKEIRDYGGEIADSIKSAMIKGVEEWEGEPEEEPPFDPYNRDYTREREEAKNAPLPKWAPDDADRLWSLAKIDLDKILKTDKSRVRVLQEVILYAETRLKTKK